jgi:serine/threonine-protein kinase
MTCPVCSANVPQVANVCPVCGLRLIGEELESKLLETLEQAMFLELGDRFEPLTRLRASNDSVTWHAREGEVDVILRIYARNRHTESAIAHTFSPAMAAVSTLEQPHIVPVNAFDRMDSGAWFTRSHVEGRSLEAALLADGPMTLDVCLPIIEQAASALQFAHRNGVVHGNVQPRNIVLNPQGWVFVTDFCANTFLDEARTPGRESPGNTRIRYPSPETTQRRVAATADQYALAMTLCRCLGMAIAPDGAQAIALNARAQNPISRSVQEAIRKALSPRPANRFATVLEFVAALSVAESSAVLHPPAPSPRPAQRTIPELLFVETPRSRPPWLIAAAAIALLAIAGVAAMRWSQREPAPVAALAQWQAADWEPSRNPRTEVSPPADTTRLTGATPNIAQESASVVTAPPTRPLADSIEVPRSDSVPPSRPPARTRAPATRPAQTARAGQQTVTEDRSATIDSSPPADAAPGRLSISSRPWGQIFLDGVSFGNTPKANLTIPAGTHVLRIVRPGYRAWERSLTVAPGQEIRLIDIVLQENRP